MEEPIDLIPGARQRDSCRSFYSRTRIRAVRCASVLPFLKWPSEGPRRGL
jgi:hypothetical protein